MTFAYDQTTRMKFRKLQREQRQQERIGENYFNSLIYSYCINVPIASLVQQVLLVCK